MDTEARSTADRVRAEMNRQGISQAQLAERIARRRGRAVSPMWVSRRVSGYVPLTRPRLTVDLVHIAEALGVTPETLADGTENVGPADAGSQPAPTQPAQ
jgi:transcriptional regulator with XRE-family HTH domain